MYDRRHTSCKEHSCKRDNERLDLKVRYKEALNNAVRKTDTESQKDGHRHIPVQIVKAHRTAHADKRNHAAD